MEVIIHALMSEYFSKLINIYYVPPRCDYRRVNTNKINVESWDCCKFQVLLPNYLGEIFEGPLAYFCYSWNRNVERDARMFGRGLQLYFFRKIMAIS